MAQPKDNVLGDACRQIKAGRDLIAEGRAMEKEGTGIAIQRMAKKGYTSFKYDGVELAFVPGVDKLRVRLTKDAETAAGETPDDDEGGDDAPDGDEGADSDISADQSGDDGDGEFDDAIH